MVGFLVGVKIRDLGLGLGLRLGLGLGLRLGLGLGLRLGLGLVFGLGLELRFGLGFGFGFGFLLVLGSVKAAVAKYYKTAEIDRTPVEPALNFPFCFWS